MHQSLSSISWSKFTFNQASSEGSQHESLGIVKKGLMGQERGENKNPMLQICIHFSLILRCSGWKAMDNLTSLGLKHVVK